jgi:N-acetyltransferase
VNAVIAQPSSGTMRTRALPEAISMMRMIGWMSLAGLRALRPSYQRAQYSSRRGLPTRSIDMEVRRVAFMRFIEPVTLQGAYATLEPLCAEHLDGIRAAAADGELWHLWYTSVPAPDLSAKWLATALDMREQSGAMPFAVRNTANGDIVGSTRYFNVDAANRRLEIGHTWYAKRAQRTAINTECKLLLLTHAFETLNCIAVEFRTHWFNQASRAAIARLGAKQDGVLRNHQLMPDGSRRDTSRGHRDRPSHRAAARSPRHPVRTHPAYRGSTQTRRGRNASRRRKWA